MHAIPIHLQGGDAVSEKRPLSLRFNEQGRIAASALVSWPCLSDQPLMPQSPGTDFNRPGELNERGKASQLGA